jgi:hypothetical protein
VLGAAPGDANEEAGHAGHEQQRAEPVHALHPLRERPARVVVVDVVALAIRPDEEGCGSEPHAAEGEIDVEAQRHDAVSTRDPPTTGPMMLPTDHAPSTMEKYCGRCLRGTMSQKMT